MEAYYKIRVKNKDVAFLLGLLFLAFGIYKALYYETSGFGFLSDFGKLNIITASSILIRLLAVLLAYKTARDMNRSIVFWIIISFLSPPLGLLILSGLKQVFPEESKDEAILIIKEYQNKIALLKNQLRFRKIKSVEFKNKKEQLENEYNQILNNRIIEIRQEKEKKRQENIYDVITIGDIIVVKETETTSVTTDKKMLDCCPACNYKLDKKYSECPDCGLNLE